MHPNYISKKIKNKGFTLIETIIYIALFTLLVGSAFVTAYQLIQGTDVLNQKSVNQEEANFVLRKINSVLNGVSSIVSPVPGATPSYSNELKIMKYGGTIVDICLHANKIKIREGGGAVDCSTSDFIPLTTDNVKVTTLQFQYVPAAGTAPAGLIASTTINGFVATTTKYIRK